MGDWEEDVFRAKISSLQTEKTPCEQALRIQRTGMVNFPRVDPMLQEQIPLLGAVTNAIAHSAVKWRSTNNILPRSTGRHDDRNARTVSGTQTGTGPCETEDSPQSTTKDETETSDASVQRSDTIGSAITIERSTTANQSSGLGKGR